MLGCGSQRWLSWGRFVRLLSALFSLWILIDGILHFNQMRADLGVGNGVAPDGDIVDGRAGGLLQQQWRGVDIGGYGLTPQVHGVGHVADDVVLQLLEINGLQQSQAFALKFH